MFCDIYGNSCFENSMDNAKVDDFCDCPMECNSISYSYRIVSTPFDPDEMCQINTSRDQFLMKEFYMNPSPPKFVRRINAIRENISASEWEICRKNIQYRAEIIFRVATNTLSVTVMSRRLSFFDKLSAFGKSKVRQVMMS